LKSGDKGLSRNALEITSATVTGDYVLKFMVDGIEKQVTLRIKNPTPQVELVSRYSGSTKQTGTAVDGTLSYSLDSETLFIELNNNGATVNKFVALNDDGEFKVERASTDFLRGIVGVFNLPAASYTYSITKSFPDGRVDTFSDVAVVTGLDANGRSLFATSGGTASANAFNTLFASRWFINTQAAIERGATGLLLGEYKYTFTIGTVTKEFVVNVVDPQELTVSKLSIGTNTINTVGSTYFATAASILGAASLEFKKYELTDDQFFTLTMGSTGALTVTQPYTTVKTSLKGLSSIKLGTIGGTAAVGSQVTATLEFFEKVDWITNNTTFRSLGTQVLTIVVGQNPSPTFAVNVQTGNSAVGGAIAARRLVATRNIPNNTVPVITWYSDSAGAAVATTVGVPAGTAGIPAAIVVVPGSVTANSVEIQFNAASGATAGTYYFTITINGVVSPVLTLILS
jgi:hypothetical protein